LYGQLFKKLGKAKKINKLMRNATLFSAGVAFAFMFKDPEGQTAESCCAWWFFSLMATATVSHYALKRDQYIDAKWEQEENAWRISRGFDRGGPEQYKYKKSDRGHRAPEP
jgi:hypothetical protein